eukprot:476941-Prymnesium_polylepis.1
MLHASRKPLARVHALGGTPTPAARGARPLARLFPPTAALHGVGPERRRQDFQERVCKGHARHRSARRPKGARPCVARFHPNHRMRGARARPAA